jgi:hypothetical protein
MSTYVHRDAWTWTDIGKEGERMLTGVGEGGLCLDL